MNVDTIYQDLSVYLVHTRIGKKKKHQEAGMQRNVFFNYLTGFFLEKKTTKITRLSAIYECQIRLIRNTFCFSNKAPSQFFLSLQAVAQRPYSLHARQTQNKMFLRNKFLSLDQLFNINRITKDTAPSFSDHK